MPASNLIMRLRCQLSGREPYPVCPRSGEHGLFVHVRASCCGFERLTAPYQRGAV